MGVKLAGRVVSCLTFAFAACLPATAGERAVTFSAYVPSTSGNLQFGPTRLYAEGFGSHAGLRLIAGNSGTQKAKLHFEAFDGHFRRTDDVELPASTTLFPGQTRDFLAIVPIMEDVKRRYRICAVLKTNSREQSRLCGKYIAQKR